MDADISYDFSRSVINVRARSYLSMVNNDYLRYQVFNYRQDTKKFNLQEFNVKAGSVITDGYSDDNFLVI